MLKGPEGPKQYTPKEMAEIKRSRALSDKQLLEGGAEYKVREKGEKILEVTKEQVGEAIDSEVFEAEREAREVIKAGKEYIESQEKHVEELPRDYLTYGGILGGAATIGGVAAGFAMNSPTAFFAGTAACVVSPLAGYIVGKFKQNLESKKLEKRKEERSQKEEQIKEELAEKTEKLGES